MKGGSETKIKVSTVIASLSDEDESKNRENQRDSVEKDEDPVNQQVSEDLHDEVLIEDAQCDDQNPEDVDQGVNTPVIKIVNVANKPDSTLNQADLGEDHRDSKSDQAGPIQNQADLQTMSMDTTEEISTDKGKPVSDSSRFINLSSR